MATPQAVVIGGPNGAGKTSAAPELLHSGVGIDAFVNVDVIAQGLSAFDPDAAAVQAGPAALARLRTLAGRGVDFAFESSLSGRTAYTFLRGLEKRGYEWHLLYLWLPSVEVSIARVGRRVEAGGHDVPTAVIRRRFRKSLVNFDRLYRPAATTWRLFDASEKSPPTAIAYGARGEPPTVLVQDRSPAMALTIKLVRHGQSLANARLVKSWEVADHSIALTPRGHEQARDAGRRIGLEFIAGGLVYASPFRRARETLQGVLAGAGIEPDAVRIYEDPRLREVEHGYADVPAQRVLQDKHGPFFYRFHGGESPADCYDRTSGFLESLMRQVERKGADRALIVTHGLTIRCFVMRFLHLTVEQFEEMQNPANGDVITIGSRDTMSDPVFATGRWGVEGLRVQLGPNET